MRTIILTGVTGFIGSHLVRELTKYYHVRCLIRADSKREFRLGVEYIEINFTNPIFKNSLFIDVFAVVHILSIKHSYHPDIQTINVDFTRMLVEASLTNRVQKFVYLSSESVQLPGKDCYTMSKKLAEGEVTKHQNHLILRPTVVYGEHDRSNIGLLIKLIKYLPIVPIIGSGTQLIQPIYVNDVAMCIVSGLRNDISGIHLIAGHKSLQYIEIVNIIAKALGKKRAIFRVPFSIGYAMARLCEVARLPFLQKSQVDNLRIDKEYSVSQTERHFNLIFSNPCEEIYRIAK
jgi:nucleoside-diphosphate-sugar epimerase